jgi:hypothetical protein
MSNRRRFGTARHVDFKGHHISKQGLWIAIEGCRHSQRLGLGRPGRPKLRRDSIKSFSRVRGDPAPRSLDQCRRSAPLRSD